MKSAEGTGSDLEHGLVQLVPDIASLLVAGPMYHAGLKPVRALLS